MSGWKAKRFWKTATVEESGAGFAILLDGRKVRTPPKTELIVPSMGLAQEIAAEWDAQEEEVNPTLMPFTKSANSAIDKVAVQFREVADRLAEYGGTDLLCYRATGPQELVDRQARLWDPVLDWAETHLGARLVVGAGVIYVPQDEEATRNLRALVHEMTPFQLAAFHDLVGMSGSLLLGFAAVHGLYPIETIWDLSRLDEIWQEEQWGMDEEATELAGKKRIEFLHAEKFYRLA